MKNYTVTIELHAIRKLLTQIALANLAKMAGEADRQSIEDAHKSILDLDKQTDDLTK